MKNIFNKKENTENTPETILSNSVVFYLVLDYFRIGHQSWQQPTAKKKLFYLVEIGKEAGDVITLERKWKKYPKWKTGN